MREAIQKMKWKPRKRPVRKSSFHRPRRIFPYPFRLRATGERSKEAKPSRYAAMAKEGASQSFTKIDAVEMATMPITRAITIFIECALVPTMSHS